MDNKQDRQLYWEVKQFLNKTPELPQKKAPGVKDVISSILQENKPYKQNNFLPNTNLLNPTNSLINFHSKIEKANAPSCGAFTKNGNTNPFNLKEQSSEPSYRELDKRLAAGKVIQDYRNSAEDFTQRARQVYHDPNTGFLGRAASGIALAFTGGTNDFSDPRSAEVKDAMNYLSNPEKAEAEQKAKDNEGWKNADAYEVQRGRLSSSEYQKRYGEAPKTPNAAAPGGVQSGAQPTQPTQPTKPTQTPQATQPSPNQTGPARGNLAPQSKPASTGTYQLTASEPVSTKVPTPPAKEGTQTSYGETIGGNMRLNTPDIPPAGPKIGLPKMNIPVASNRSAGQLRAQPTINQRQPSDRQLFTGLMSAQNQQASMSAVGQLGAVQGPTVSQFSGSVLPGAQNLAPRTLSQNEFRYARGSRLA